jgi:hypothetical protein
MLNCMACLIVCLFLEQTKLKIHLVVAMYCVLIAQCSTQLMFLQRTQIMTMILMLVICYFCLSTYLT